MNAVKNLLQVQEADVCGARGAPDPQVEEVAARGPVQGKQALRIQPADLGAVPPLV